MVKLLLDFKANRLATDQNHKTALYYAVLHEYFDIAHCLLANIIERSYMGQKINAVREKTGMKPLY